MRTRKTLSVFFIIALCCAVFVSCNAEGIMKLGNRMNKVGNPIFGTNLPKEEINGISDSLKSLADLQEDDISSQLENDLITYVQKIKKSPALVADLSTMLDEEITVSPETLLSLKFMSKGVNYISKVALNPAEEVPNLVDKVLTPIANSLAEYLASAEEDSDLKKLISDLSKTLGIEIDEESVIFIVMLAPMLVEEISADYITTNIVPIIEPFMDLIRDIKNAQSILLEGFEGSTTNMRLLACAAVNERFIFDIVSLVADASDSSKDIVSSISKLVVDLDTLSVLDSRMKFDSLNTLVDKFNLGDN